MMRNFIAVMNILALTLPFLAAEVQNPDPTCPEKDEILYDQRRVLNIPVRYMLSRNLRYEPNYYHYRPFVAIDPYMYYSLITRLLLLRSPAQIFQWQTMPNLPQPTEVPHPIPSPSFLAIPTNQNDDTTAMPTVDTNTPVESTPVPIIEPVEITVANPEASTEPVNNPETATVPVLSSVA
ncbi:kappa-casein isoform X1 [Microtus oregoni]|uniref:kappa-casein isoform X1 n=1 Tax=Microtus oregoni TaxID=111838 RepID=UPI001BB1654A|nr:kappa-casein isoform X1 [Microtus oregoni]